MEKVQKKRAFYALGVSLGAGVSVNEYTHYKTHDLETILGRKPQTVRASSLWHVAFDPR
jgi:hypothetical protein